ncbi:MAG: DUF1376 domain-containing protein [Sulfitobacter sp.]
MAEFNAKQARAKRPCPLWVDAFQRDTQHLQADEVGAYMLILMAMWTRETCDFPDDDSRLARISRVSVRLWKSRIGPIIREFLQAADGAIFSKRLREEATYVERHCKEQSNRKNGKKSRKPLKTNKPGVSTDMTTDDTADIPPDKPTQQPNNPTIEEKDKSSSSMAKAVLTYQDYLDAHPNPVESPFGEVAFDDLVKAGTDPAQIVAAANSYANKVRSFSNPDFIQQSDNFLDPERGKWRQHVSKPNEPTATIAEQKIYWASQIKAGKGFGLEKQMAQTLVAGGHVTEQELAAAAGYNG